MKIITLNCNGVRSAAKKGFYTWMKNQRADVLCLQETKAQGIGDELIDREGRYLEVCFENLSVVSLSLPSGSSGDIRQEFKIRMMGILLPHLLKLKKRKRQYIICGDWNIAHTNADIRNWRGNQKNSGFLPEEREWLTELFDKYGYVDAFRTQPQKEHEYTWWSNSLS